MSVVEDVIAKFEERIGTLSGSPPDFTDLYDELRAAFAPRQKKTVVRSAESGEFVTKAEAKKKPATTVTQKVTKPATKTKGK